MAAAPVAALAPSAGAAALVLLFPVAVHRPWNQIAPVGALYAAAALAQSALHPDEERGFLLQTLISVLFGAAIVALGMYVPARRELARALHDRVRAAEADQQLRAEQARAAERARIAREMHDVLAHRISLLSMQADALEFRPDASTEEVAAAAGVIRASAHQALEELREVIGVLRSDTGTLGDDGREPTRPQPTLAELPALLAESREVGLRIRDEIALEGDPSAVPAAVGRTVYRIVQEGLTNARKHAPGVEGAPGARADRRRLQRSPGRRTTRYPTRLHSTLGMRSRGGSSRGHTVRGTGSSPMPVTTCVGPDQDVTASGRPRGRRRVKVAPPPGVGWTLTDPWCSCATCWLMARPRPAPLVPLRTRDGSVR